MGGGTFNSRACTVSFYFLTLHGGIERFFEEPGSQLLSDGVSVSYFSNSLFGGELEDPRKSK